VAYRRTPSAVSDNFVFKSTECGGVPIHLAGSDSDRQGAAMKLAIGMIFSAWVGLASPGFAAPPVETVEKLYTEHLAGRGPLKDDSQTGWKSTFAPALLKVMKAAEGWQFDPLLFAQDFDTKAVEVTEIEEGKSQALVLVKFQNFGKTTSLVVSLKKSGNDFLIENIVEPATGIDLINNIAN
jgi:hypothetical protein